MKIKYIIWSLFPKFIKEKIFKKIVKNNHIPFLTFDLTDFFSRRINIWENVYIWENVKLLTIENTKVNIWKYSSIASWCRIITYNHNINFPSPHLNQWKKRIDYIGKHKVWDINIWNDVWIWFNCIILPWVTIWDWAVIWAWAIVSKNVEPYSIVVWNPWLEVKKRFKKEIIDFLLELKWWDWSEEKIKLNSEFFNIDLTNYYWDITKIVK